MATKKKRQKAFLPKGKVTLLRLERLDSVHDAIEELLEHRAAIQHFVVLSMDNEDAPFRWSWGGKANNILYMLERTKAQILHDQIEHEDEEE